MIPVQSQVPQSLFVKPLDVSFPCKPDFPIIDFLDLVSTNNPSASTLSINDDYASVQADDDLSKPLTEFDTLAFRLSKRVRKQKKIAKQQQDQTLVEIISKRVYTKPVKATQNVTDNLNEAITKKRRLNNEEVELANTKTGASIETEAYQRIDTTNWKENGLKAQPQLVLRDGKVHFDGSQLVQEKSQGKPLEVVKFNKKKVTTSSSFRKTIHTEKWTAKETKKFYRALEIFGTDFAMITKLFQNRNRNQIKNKFLREEKTAPERVDAIFKKTKAINFQKLITLFQNKSAKYLNYSNKNILSKADLISHTQQEIAVRKRSGSFNSVTSLDSVDMTIMEDLAEVFMPMKPASGLPATIKEASS